MVTSTGQVVITDSQILPVNNTVIKPVPLPIVPILPEEPIVDDIITIIGDDEEFSGQIGANVQVISVVSQTTSVGAIFTATVTSDDTQGEFNVILEQDDLTGELVIVDSRPTSQVTVIEVEQQQVTIEIDTEPLTGVSHNWTVPSEIKEEDLVYVPVFEETSVISGVLTTEYTTSIEQTTVYKYQNGSGIQVTVIVNKDTK